MNPLTCSGLSRLQFRSKCLSLFPVALIVVSAYAFFFMYHRVSKILFVLEGVSNSLFVWDAVVLLGDDVAVPDRPKAGMKTNRLTDPSFHWSVFSVPSMLSFRAFWQEGRISAKKRRRRLTRL